MENNTDIVDEKDNVIGQKTKKECHEKGILHRGASILLFRDSYCRQLLIQKRSKFLSGRGKWNHIGGHLNPGENYLDGAKRQLLEEMFFGKELPDLKFSKLFKFKKTADNDYEFLTIYRVIYGGKFSLNPEEVEAYAYVNINDVIKDVEKTPEKYTGTFKAILQEYKQRFLEK